MPRKRNPIPSYLYHNQTGRARAVWSDQTGGRRFQILPGAYDSPESRAAFTSLLLAQQAAPHRVDSLSHSNLTLAELLLAYLGRGRGGPAHRETLPDTPGFPAGSIAT
jgi:hypothetical protein